LKNSKNILVSPLDWGLGHATRCIPIIKHLLDLGHNVILGAYGKGKILLEDEFPQLTSVEIDGITMTYQNKGSFALTIGAQILGYLKSIRREHQLVQKIIAEYNIDLIISDNRYGAYSSIVPSIIISHQINILMPKGLQFTSSIVNGWVHKQLKKFNAIWIPDYKGKESIAGALSNNKFAHQHCKYLGILSRFSNGQKSSAVKKTNSSNENIKVLAVLSGPEPQRTKFEELLLEKTLPSNYNLTIVRGLPDAIEPLKHAGVTIINFLNGDDLKTEIENCNIYVGRTGYTTVMDLLCIGKQAILVPTPGQPEQEYLGETMANGTWFKIYSQNSFNFNEAITLKTQSTNKIKCNQFKEVIDETLLQLF